MKIDTSLTKHLIKIISETNGISLEDTLELATFNLEDGTHDKEILNNFRVKLAEYDQDKITIEELLDHPVSNSLFDIFKNFPIPYREEHIHLTGSLSAEFVYPRLKTLLDGPNADIYWNKIKAVYPNVQKIDSVEDVAKLMTLQEGEAFDRYLEILLLPKLILTTREAHAEASYSMAKNLYEKFNVGMIRLKFTLSRATSNDIESIPGIENLTEEDVVLGLHEGFKKFKSEVPGFKYILSPSFRKEANHFDSEKYESKKEHFDAQVSKILEIIDKYPELVRVLREVDTVGNERELYRKIHFHDMKKGLRRLQYRGFSIRSHHGETWKTLKMGVQAVDNAMNIWHINTLEHGLSLGINPNYYFHSLYLRVIDQNQNSKAITIGTSEYNELVDMDWGDNEFILNKLLNGEKLSEDERTLFVKAKFHTAREIEHYQHDVLNRMIHKKVSLIALPSSNMKLTGAFPDYKDHPFSWWEKKGVKLGIGTDNYFTLGTNYIKELLIALYTDTKNLKITKLLMVATGEQRRPYISQLLWKLREKYISKDI